MTASTGVRRRYPARTIVDVGPPIAPGEPMALTLRAAAMATAAAARRRLDAIRATPPARVDPKARATAQRAIDDNVVTQWPVTCSQCGHGVISRRA